MKLLILVIGGALVYLLQLLFFRLSWNRKLSALVSFTDQIVDEGAETELLFRIENHKSLPVIALKTDIDADSRLRFKDQNNLSISDKNYRSEIFSLKGHEAVERKLPLLCPKRGFYHVDGVDLVGTDLFYSRRFILHQESPSDICVLPGKADPRKLLAASQKMMGDIIVKNSDMLDPFTFRGIRQYQPFDPIRDINWKASARTGDLRVNIRDYSSDQELGIILDSSWDALLRPDALIEESIRIACGLSEEILASGISCSLVSNGRDVLTGERVRLDAGGDMEHARSIKYSLARLEIPAVSDQNSTLDLLDELIFRTVQNPGRRISWILISTQACDELISRWNKLSELSSGSFWVYPCFSLKDSSTLQSRIPELIPWEVAYGK